MSIYGEVPSGAVNGTNAVFTTSQAYYAGSTRVYVNGLRKHLSVDYTESAASTLTFAAAPASASVILVDYDITAGGTNYPLGEWTLNPEGYGPGAGLYYGPVLFPAGIDPGATQTVVCVFGPGGARINVPALAQGDPGPPPGLEIGTVETLTAGSDVTVSLTEVTPGGPGVAGLQALNFGIPEGAAGESGSFALASATDIVGSLSNLFTLVWNSATSKFNPTPLPFLFAYNVTGIGTTTTSAGQIRSLDSLTITGQAVPYLPVVFASCEVAGTTATKVDIVARLGGSANSQSGTEIGRGFGVLGATPPPPSIVPEWATLLAGGSAAQVAASTSATIYLNCEQQASTTDEYSTGRCNFTVVGFPLAS